MRYICREIGYEQAWSMPTEWRHWWIEQMQKDNAPQEKEAEAAFEGRSRVVPK